MADVGQLVLELYQVIDELEAMYPGRHFTPDGHVVGSLGEAIAAEAFDLELKTASNEGFDAETRGEQPPRTVEIKATQGKSISLQADVAHPDHLIALHIDRTTGHARVVYNGPASPVCRAAGKRQKNGQQRISIPRLAELMSDVADDVRLPLVTPLP